MAFIKAYPLPDVALLKRYVDGNSYTDCYSTTVEKDIRLAEFVADFYTTAVFKLERVILKVFARLPSTDEQAKQVANGETDLFAAWTVEAHADNQLLMCDVAKRTRSWFMVSKDDADDVSKTRLFFGSAVVAIQNTETGKMELGTIYRILLGFHKLYSKILLRAAVRKVNRRLS